MKTTTHFLVMAAFISAVLPALAGGQELGLRGVDRFAAWLNPVGAEGLGGPPEGYADPAFAEDVYCGSGRCGDCVGCCRTNDTWASMEMLVWWAKGTPLPPLVTTALPGTPLNPLAPVGAIDQPNTRILFGNQQAADEAQIGTRLAAGVWLDTDHNTTLGGRFFILEGNATQFFQASPQGDPILARPFFNPLLGIQDALLVAYPGLRRGSVTARAAQDNTLGVESFLEIMLDRNQCRRIDLVVGYQFMRLDDRLDVSSTSIIDDGGPLTGTSFVVTDRFLTENEFHGGEAGVRARFARGCWSLDALGKMGIGNMRQQVAISGETVITDTTGASVTNPSGLLAQPSNIGVFQRDKFAFIPELTFNLKYHVNRCLNFHLGYSIIMLTDVALSGEQIDFSVDSAQIVDPPRPAFVFRDQEYWLQGINFGMNFDF